MDVKGMSEWLQEVTRALQQDMDYDIDKEYADDTSDDESSNEEEDGRRYQGVKHDEEDEDEDENDNEEDELEFTDSDLERDSLNMDPNEKGDVTSNSKGEQKDKEVTENPSKSKKKTVFISDDDDYEEDGTHPHHGHDNTNEFYDEHADDKDEFEYHQQYIRQFGSDLSSIDLYTDATLTCPMCFTTLTEFCQQHEEYIQWRAVFVQNCYVHRAEPDTSNPKSIQEHRRVDCQNCGTEVAAVDKDNVYHFFHVIANETTLPNTTTTKNTNTHNNNTKDKAIPVP